MRATLLCRIAFASTALLVSSSACHSTTTEATPAPPTPPTPCSVQATADAMQAFAMSDLTVHFETGGDASLELVRADLQKYLSTLWGAPVTVTTDAPDFSSTLTIWLSTSTNAATKAGRSSVSAPGYSLVRTDDGQHTVLVAAAADPETLSYAAYALMEELGVRFFHPKQELVPTFDGPRIPAAMSIARAPAATLRGLQPHTLHPIEYFEVFQVPSAQNLADAKLFIDWLVKTGQNELQWPLLSTVDFKAWTPHAQAILDYAHSRHVRVGAVVQVFGGASLQNNYVLAPDSTQPASQMAAPLDTLMTLNWDLVELALGEFVGNDPQTVIDYLNYDVDHLLTAFPKLQVDVQNHVGNYPNLWVQYQGQTVFYYHLPQFADPRLGQSVHTLSIFDVYRDWATYAHPDFHLQHDYLLDVIKTRNTGYFPESAYWISADIDVPLFLPTTLYARWNDIHRLVAELAADGLPPLDGHVMFTTGHEWNYWLTDYLTAKMLWDPGADLTTFLTHYAGGFGSCAGDVATDMTALVDLQNKYVFDQRLFPYLQGENLTVALGYIAGLETHPKRIAFEDVQAMSAPDRASFEASVVVGLESMAGEMRAIEDGLGARCTGADAVIAPWCGELLDGIIITRMRAQHAAHLYRSILDFANGGDGESDLSAATALSQAGLAVVARRENGYRFDLSRYIDDYDNATIYPFGALRTVHSLCYWGRQEQQVQSIIEDGTALEVNGLPTCND